MKTSTFAFLLSGIGAAMPAFAGNRVADIAAENPRATPYQILEQLYNESTLPASTSDFDLNTDDHSNQYCVAAIESTRAPFSLYVVRVEVIVKPGIPPQPAKGPLFPATPGIPDETRSILLINSTARHGLDRKARSLAASEKITQSATDLALYITGANEIDYQPILYKFRKNGNLIAVKGVYEYGTPNETTYFAYCYR